MYLKKICTCILCFVSVLSTACYSEDKTKIVFLHGGKSHKPGDHEFTAGAILLSRALNEQSGLPVEVVTHKNWPDDESILEGAAAVIFYNDATKIVEQGWEKVDALADKGVGLMFIHYAVHPNKDKGLEYFAPWIGGFMETGYSVNPHWVADLYGKPDHPVSNGVTYPVRTLDEYYYLMRFPKDLPGERHDLIIATPCKECFHRTNNLWTEAGEKAVGTEQTLMWGYERPNGGRGVGFTGGHYHRNWAVDDFRKNVLNAIVWVAGMEVPEQGVQSLQISEATLNENLDGVPRTPLRVPTDEELDSLSDAKNLLTFKEWSERRKKRNR
ncbi:MAG: ThuA domain-containing protein [Opitutales bacterium]